MSQTQIDTLNSNEEQNEIENPVNVDASNVDIEDKQMEEMIQDLKFITISIFNRESKIMMQGSSGNIKCFITDYFQDLDKYEITANGLVSTVDQPNEEETRIPIKIEELNLNDKMNETEKSNDVTNENSGELLTTTLTTKPQQSDL